MSGRDLMNVSVVLQEFYSIGYEERTGLETLDGEGFNIHSGVIPDRYDRKTKSRDSCNESNNTS